MESFIFIVFNLIFYSFLYYVLYSFEFFSNLSSSSILLSISLIISLPSIIFMYILKKDRIKFFLLSSIWTIFISFIFFYFGVNILNFTSKVKVNFIYIYTYIYTHMKLIFTFDEDIDYPLY